MATRKGPKKLVELPAFAAANNIASGDLFLIEDVSAGITKTANSDIVGAYLSPLGPYADDTAANTAGVAVGRMYYTAAGAVKVRLA